MVVPLSFSTIAAGHLTYSMLASLAGTHVQATGEASHLALMAFTITMFLAYDLSYYLYHVMQHRIPFMWELHKVHHSAEVMVGVTKDRVHPLDEIMNSWWNGLIPGITYGVWLFFLQDPVELTIFGINVYFIRNTLLMMDFVRHTHMKLSYGRWLNALFICPHYHQLHHSVAQEHWDRNFGLSLTLWDWLFGTLVVPKPAEDFVFGLQNREAEEYRSVLRLHLVPIKRILLLIGTVRRRASWPLERARAHGIEPHRGRRCREAVMNEHDRTDNRQGNGWPLSMFRGDCCARAPGRMSSRATRGSSAWSNSAAGRGCRLRIAVAWRGDELVASAASRDTAGISAPRSGVGVRVSCRLLRCVDRAGC